MRKAMTRKSVKKEDYEDLVFYRLKNSRFKQQRLPAWRPVPTFYSIIIFYLSFAIIFIIIGIVLLVYSGKIVSLEHSYHQECKDKEECTIKIKIEKDMEKPIFIYYKLDGFFQNNRRYVKSKSLKQLTGDSASKDGDCAPIYFNKDLGFSNEELAELELEPDKPAVPCGLMAKTYFNDIFYNWRIHNEEDNEEAEEEIEVNEENIAWAKDREIFKNPDISKQWMDIEDEHFIVWMRNDGLPDVKKLWGRIEDIDLKKGDEISVDIENNYKVSHYDGGKSLILTTTNKFGGKNIFMGVCFIVIGVISLILGIAFPILIMQRNKQENNKKND